jgi:hypothetical protein
MGDDFSVDQVDAVTIDGLAQPYRLQRPFLSLVAQSAPLFLLNGNHEQASLFNFDQTDLRHHLAIWVQKARNNYYPTCSPDTFYTGDTKIIEPIGLLKDYYAWTWGDSGFREEDGIGRGDYDEKSHQRDWWGLTLGDTQYQWLKKTLSESTAKHKFVFAHHVHGSGRGGIELCNLYEWGGHDRRGEYQFPQRRPNWEMPVHQLMVKYGVSVFFQGHDHLYCRQEQDGLVYQEVPMPADPFYQARNVDQYQSGVRLPNSGHLRVTVNAEAVKIDYVRSFLPTDETATQKSGDIAYSYSVAAKKPI